MHPLIQGLESLFNLLPPALLEVWGRLAYILGLLLALCAYGGFTFRPRGQWGLGRIRQSWDGRALMAMGITFAAVPLAGWIGSGIVLVEGAQTFESLKDVAVFLAIVLFGYPALLAVPPAYMLADLIEGVPPGFVFDWTLGYFCWTAFVWLAAQFIGHLPDFRRARTWLAYAAFVAILMSLDPVMWGYLCSSQFGSAVSFTAIAPALSFTLIVSWICAPFAMLAALPLARRFGLFWAEAEGYVRERRFGETEQDPEPRGLPLRLLLTGSFVGLAALLVFAVSVVALRSGTETAEQLAGQLHEEVAEGLNQRLDNYLDAHLKDPPAARLAGARQVLAGSPFVRTGRVYLLDRRGHVQTGAPEARADDPVVAAGLARLAQTGLALVDVAAPRPLRFDVVTAKPLARTTWLAQLTPYTDGDGSVDWLIFAAMPESHYLAGLQKGGSHTALLAAVVLTLTLALAAGLAALVAAPIRRVGESARAMAEGDWYQHVQPSAMQELNTLVESFNAMGEQLHEQFERARASETRAKAMFDASPTAMVVFDVLGFNLENLEAGRRPVVSHVNAAWERVTGHSLDEVLGRSTNEFALWADPADRQRLADLLKRDGAVNDYATRLSRSDGQVFDASISMRSVQAGADTLVVFALADVTDVNQTHAQLKSLNQQLGAAQTELLNVNASLDRRVKERTHELELTAAQLRTTLDHLQRAQSQLVQSEKLASLGNIVARVAHELNTPLGIAVTAGSTLIDLSAVMRTKIADGQLRRSEFDDFLISLGHSLQLVLGAVERAHKLVLTFKQVAVDQSGEARRAFMLDDCLQDMRALLDTTLRKTPHQLTLTIEPGLAMDSYPGAVEQLFVNFVNNAVLHAFDADTPGHMHLKARRLPDEEIELVFEDDGRGMSESVRRHAFDPFFTTRMGTGGTGLGLTICFNIVTGTLGGQLTLDSVEGRGTRFVVRMPMVAPSTTVAAERAGFTQ